MTLYILKKGQEGFRVMSGEFAGRRFEPGKPYTEIPKADRRRFEEVDVQGRTNAAGAGRSGAVKPPAVPKPTEKSKGGDK